MNCPKCGYERQIRDDAFVPPGECPACGVVYAKHDATDAPAGTVRPMPASNLRPSPVDALSLRKARERVERKLREQQGKRAQDDRHVRTLELAKQLASEELRKRQEEWKQAHADAEESVTPEADAELQAPVSKAEPALEDDPSPDRTQPADQAEDEMITTTVAAMEETADPPAPVVENPPKSADDGEAAAAGDSLENPESAPDDEVQTLPTEAPEYGAAAEPLSTAAWLLRNPGAKITEHQDGIPAAHVAAPASPRAPKSGSGSGLTRLLPVVAWLILGAGIIGAVLSWTTISEVEAGARIPMAGGLNSLPLGLLLGFAYLATGVLGFAFFWVSSLISTQLRDIHRLLLPGEGDENTLRDGAA